MKKFLILLFVCLVSFSMAQTTIMMEKEGGVFTVPCLVNALKLRFIFDTGASDVSISLTEANMMLKNGYLSKNDIIGKEYFVDAKGEISEGTKIILRKIEFAGMILTNVEATVIHEYSAPLLLGQSAMAKLGTFQLDPNKGTLIILNGKKSDNVTDEKSNISKTELVENTPVPNIKSDNKAKEQIKTNTELNPISVPENKIVKNENSEKENKQRKLDFNIKTNESILNIPTVLTPNDDGINDFMYVSYVNVKSLNCSIFNRWGESVAKFKDTFVIWDGNGDVDRNFYYAKSGIYYYVIEVVYNDGAKVIYKDTITLTH